ncbi:hypothetical protein HAZT_HAZT000382 [Hyalella azteca]|nr:hypothetical protein HAZT_HAZT000382 [Hyalella azteca]
MSEWERIKRQCQGKRELYEDPDFAAVQTSVFYHQAPPFTFTWLRPQDLVQNPTFIRDEHTQFDLTPGKLGDRWLVSCLGCLQLAKGLFYRVVPADQAFSNKSGYCGAFR